jgi:hypothetical protein
LINSFLKKLDESDKRGQELAKIREEVFASKGKLRNLYKVRGDVNRLFAKPALNGV